MRITYGFVDETGRSIMVVVTSIATDGQYLASMFEIDGIAGNLIASAIWLVLGIAAGSLYQYSFKRRRLRRVWRLSRRDKGITVVAAALAPQPTGVYERPSTGLGELRASALVHRALAEAYPRRNLTIDVELSSLVQGASLRFPLILIGGPRYNSVTSTLTERFDLAFNYEMAPVTTIIDKRNGQRYTPNLEENEEKVDYGILCRLPNVFEKGSPAFVLSGAHTYGVTGTAKMLTGQYGGDLGEAVHGLGSSWEALIRADYIAGEVFPSVIAVAGVEVPVVTSLDGVSHAPQITE